MQGEIFPYRVIGKCLGRKRNQSSQLNSMDQEVAMERKVEMALELDEEEIVKEIGLGATVVDHLDCVVEDVDGITRKMSRMVKANILVDLVEEDLVVARVCRMDPEEKDLVAGAAEAVEEVFVEANRAALLR